MEGTKTKTDFRKIAHQFLEIGLNPIQFNADKSIALKTWKHLQKEKNIPANFNSCEKIGIVCGKISKNLTVLDIDCKHDTTGKLWTELKDNLESYFQNFNDFCIVKTINSGYHIPFYCEKIEGGQKLALNANKECIIETRAEGNCIICAPSEGYSFIQNDYSKIPTLTTDQYNDLLNICKSFNEIIAEPTLPKIKSDSKNKNIEIGSFEDYNNKTSCLDLLTTAGWSVAGTNNLGTLLTRPNKSKGVSGIVFNNNCFRCFTTSTQFENDKTFNPAQIYTILNHNSDYSTASKELFKKGFGKLKEKETTTPTNVENIDFVFWHETEKTDKKGNIEYKLNIDFLKLYDFFEAYGIQKIIIDEKGLQRILVQIQNNIVKEIDIAYMRKLLQLYVDNLPFQISINFNKLNLKDLILKGINVYIEDAKIDVGLKCNKINFLTDKKDEAYFFFKNGFVTVNKTEIELRPYTELKGYIWKSQIIEHDFIFESNLENIKSFDFYKFTQNVCTIKDTNTFDEKRWNSLCSTIGYLLHNYKNTANSKAIIFTEANLTDEKQGRTGKGLIMQSIGKLRKLSTEDGKNFSFDSQFRFQKIDLDTQIFFIDDVLKNFDFERLYSAITEGITFEKKHKDSVYLAPEKAPKIVISTNFAIKGNSESDKGRRFEMELYCYYNSNFTPENDFKRLFFIDYNSSDWNTFYNFMLRCNFNYFEDGSKLNDYNSNTIEYRRLLTQTSKDFVEFAENLKVNVDIKANETYHEYLRYAGLTEKNCTNNQFSKMIKCFADYKGYKNKKDKITNPVCINGESIRCYHFIVNQ